MNHFTVYHNPESYAAFPSLAIDGSGIVYCAFRLVPSKWNKTHIDTRSIAVLYKSADGGEAWQMVSELRIGGGLENIGIQDPSLCILKNGTFLLNCFGWSSSGKHTRKPKQVRIVGVLIFTSVDKGKTWSFPVAAPDWPPKIHAATSEPVVEADDNSLLLAGYTDLGGGGDACILLRRIEMQWQKGFIRIAHDPGGSLNFQEPALADLGDDHLVCLMRVPFDDGSRIYQAHSWDGGETWEAPRDTKMRGLPPSLTQLSDGRLLCTYGYRKPPYGIRACVSRNRGLTWDTADEIMLRGDGGGWDVGYPSTVQLEGGELLTAYYWYSREDKTRRIEVTRWKL